MAIDILGAEKTANVRPVRRYTETAQALHWITAALMFAVIPLAWVMVSLPRSAPNREFYYDLHKSIGLTILALVVVRLLWRAAHPAPDLPGGVARFERVAAFASHWLLYLILLGMPVSGYLLSAAGGHPVNYFGLFTLPSIPANETVAKVGVWLHVATGQWAVYALISLHILATVWHVAVRRDGVFERILPS
jgi:cytochrome b561